MDHNIHHRGLTPQSYNKPEQLNEIAPGFASGGLAARAAAGAAAARPSRRAVPSTTKGRPDLDILNRMGKPLSGPASVRKQKIDIAKANVEPSGSSVTSTTMVKAMRDLASRRETARTTPGTSAYKADQRSSRLRDQTDKIRQGMRDDRLRHQAKVGKGAYKAARPFTLPDTPQGNRDRQRAALAAKRGRRDQRMQNQQSLSRRGPDAGPVKTGDRSDGQKSALKKMADMNKAWDAKTPDEKRAVRAKQKAARIAARAAKP